MSITFGSLFTGFGMLDLGLENAGLECKWQVEINETANKFLEKNFPGICRLNDVRNGNKTNLGRVNLICGGFPCQDVSISNHHGKGVAGGERSGLWAEFYRLIRVLRPRYALIENVTNLTRKGLEIVLCDLAASGYDAEWTVIRASDFGAFHSRERLFIFAHAAGKRLVRGEIFQRKHFESFRQETSVRDRSNPVAVHPQIDGRSYPRIPEHIRMADESSEGLDEILRGLGNGVVPIIGEFIGRQIIKFDRGEI